MFFLEKILIAAAIIIIYEQCKLPLRHPGSNNGSILLATPSALQHEVS